MTEHRPFDFTNPTAYIYPKAAWDKLRMAGRDRQNVYLYGATGYGKTELLRRLFRRRKSFWFSAQELTAAQLQNLPAPGPEGELNVVIDDLALAQADDVQQEILHLLDVPGVWLVMAGRCPLPTWLTKPYVRGRLRIIPEEDLWLSGAEIKQLYLGWGVQLPHRLMEERVVPLVEGNPFAARLLAMEMSRGQSYTDALMDELTRKFYEYLNHAIYDNWPEEIRAVLMQLSVLQHFTLAQAEALTGRKDVNQVLSRAAETGNLFSMREGVYTLRPGVIHSMQLRIEKTYDRAQQADLYRRAGKISEDEGDFPRALALYQKGRCPERLRTLLIENARRCPSGGYYYELAPAYLALPEDEVKESPDLIGALSMLHSLALNATESERWYDILRQYRETHTDPEAQRRAESWQIYLDISLPHRGIADLLDVLADAEEKIARDQLELPAFSVTSGQPSLMNGSKDFCDWTREDTAVAARLEEHAGAVLGSCAKGLVTLGLAESRLEKGDDDYQVLELINRGLMENLDGGKFELQYVGAALLARYYLLTGHLADCRKTLQEIEEKARQRGARRIVQNIHALQCRMLLWAGRVEDATLWMKREPPRKCASTCWSDTATTPASGSTWPSSGTTGPRSCWPACTATPIWKTAPGCRWSPTSSGPSSAAASATRRGGHSSPMHSAGRRSTSSSGCSAGRARLCCLCSRSWAARKAYRRSSGPGWCRRRPKWQGSTPSTLPSTTRFPRVRWSSRIRASRCCGCSPRA